MTDKDLVVTTILSPAIKCAAKARISRALRENTNKRVGEAVLVAHWAMGVSVPWRGLGFAVRSTQQGTSGVPPAGLGLQFGALCRGPGIAYAAE